MSTRRQLFHAIYWGFVWNLGVAAVLNNPIHPSAKTWVAVLAAANEFFGVVLVASPEWLPHARAALKYARLGLGRAALAFRRYFHISKHHYGRIMHLPDLSGSGVDEYIRDAPRGLDLQTAVDWLLAEHTRLASRIDALEGRVGGQPAIWREDIRQARAAIMADTQAALRGLENRNLPLRLAGLGYLVIGLSLSAAANLL